MNSDIKSIHVIIDRLLQYDVFIKYENKTSQLFNCKDRRHISNVINKWTE